MKTLAMYLPQYHKVKENDEWWGEGFTEWTAVKNAKPLFEGQVQPRVPLNDNYYDLEHKDTMLWQAGLAKEYGIDGFCFYHYWFKASRKILEKPAELLLGWKDVDMPFCFCWATATWARSWTNITGKNSWADVYEGKSKNNKDNVVLIEQDYGDEVDWKNHFDYLLDFFKDERYIKLEGKPVFVIDTTAGTHGIERMIAYWRGLACENGLSGLYIILMNAGVTSPGTADALVSSMSIKSQAGEKLKNGVCTVSYSDTYDNYLSETPNTAEQCILWGMVDYDDTPRRGQNGKCFINASPIEFEKYFKRLIEKSYSIKAPFVFLNAWNEWGEGMYLEPDEIHGFGYLEAVRNAKKKADISIEWYPNPESMLKEISVKNTENAILKRNYELALSWISMKNCAGLLKRYLQDKGINSIAIYGCGTHGKLLETELKKNGIDNLFGIDKRAAYIKSDMPLYDLGTDKYPHSDLMIISVLGHYSTIESSMRDKLKCPIIEIDEFISSVLKSR